MYNPRNYDYNIPVKPNINQRRKESHMMYSRWYKKDIVTANDTLGRALSSSYRVWHGVVPQPMIEALCNMSWGGQVPPHKIYTFEVQFNDLFGRAGMDMPVIEPMLGGTAELFGPPSFRKHAAFFIVAKGITEWGINWLEDDEEVTSLYLSVERE